MNTIRLILGDSLIKLKEFEACSIDVVVTDPPYEISFAAKSWDGSGIAFSHEIWDQCLRVLKPNGVIKAFSGTRTFHRMIKAMREAGFVDIEVHAWTYGSGVPKSHPIAVYMDRTLTEGHSRQILRKGVGSLNGKFNGAFKDFESQSKNYVFKTEEARQWSGYGNALNPAWEPIVVARKPS